MRTPLIFFLSELNFLAEIKKLDDAELIRQYLQNQSSLYFSTLYDRYSTKIYSKCLSLLKDEMLAEDACQEIFMKIFLNLNKFKGDSKFSTWTYSVTYNFCIDLIRRKKKDNVFFPEDEPVSMASGGDREIEDKLLMEMEYERLSLVMENIPIEDRAVLIMKYKDDLSIREISNIFAKSESAIKMKIKRAKQKARVYYEKEFDNVATNER